jgi:TM2 domain-containing membrane protein YozV
MKPANKVALVLITFFFGAIGGHKYYVKKHGLGILYLLFIWTAIPSIVAFVEFVIYIIKSEEDLEQAYPDTLSAGATAGFIIGAIVLCVVLVGGAIVAIGMIMGFDAGV